MTKKPFNPSDDPPTPSSSGEDEVESSSGEEEEEDSSSEEDEPKAPSATVTIAKAPSATVTIAVPGKPTVPATSTKQKSDSDSGSETETDSDSETEQASKNPNTESGKAIAVTVADTNPKKKEALSSATNPKKKKDDLSSATSPKKKEKEGLSSATNPKKKEKEGLSSATLALPAVKSGTKRPSEGTSRDGNAKRAKKVSSGEDEKKIGEDTKKSGSQRLWGEEDEIALLQGIIDFKGDTDKNPSDDTNGFYNFVKKSISIEVSKNQMMDKVRALKKKYTGTRKNGKQLSFLKPHDLKAFALSKCIWDPEAMGLESAKSNGTSKNSQSKMKKLESVKQDLFSSLPNGKNVEEDGKKVLIHGRETSDWFESSFLVPSIAGFGVDEDSVKQSWRSTPVESKKKIEEMMNALRAKEIDFVLQKTQYMNEVTSMIAEAITQRDM